MQSNTVYASILIYQCLSLALNFLATNFSPQYCFSVTLFWMISASFPRSRWLMSCFTPFFESALNLSRDSFLSPAPTWVVVAVWLSNSLNSLTSTILMGRTSCLWMERMRTAWKELEWFLPEAVKEFSLSAVNGVLSENFLTEFLSRLLLISFNFQKLVRLLGDSDILMGLVFLGGRQAGTLGLECVSIQLLISQETTFLLLERKSNQKREVLRGEKFIDQLIYNIKR